MKLYETAASPSSRRVSIFLKELKLDLTELNLDLKELEAIEFIQVNIRGGENLTSEFQQMSPSGKVPTLVLDNQETLSESVAICRYFDAKYDYQSGLFGHNAIEQAQIEMWHRIVEFEGLYTAFQAFRNLTCVYSDRERCVSAWGEESKLRVMEFLPKLEQQLGQSTFVATHHFTIVDITAAIFIGFLVDVMKVSFLDEYPNIKAWFTKILSRPSFS